MVYSGSFSFLKERLLDLFKEIKPNHKTVVITHTNRMKQFLKEYLVSNLGIISNTKFYTLIDISKKISGIEPIQDFDKKVIIKKAIADTGYREFEGLVEEVADIIQHIKEYKLDIDSLQNEWVRNVYHLYEKEKDGYFDREDTHRIACETQTDWHADNIIVFGFRTVAPLHRDLFGRLKDLSNQMFAFLPVIVESGYAENHKSFMETVKFFEEVTGCKSIHELEENFDSNINIGRNVYRFSYLEIPVTSPNISIFSCQDEEEEVRHTASKLVELVLSGAKFHQIGIVIPDIKRYIPFIKDIFSRYHIPYYVIEDNRYIDSVLYRQLFNLFKLRENHLSKDTVLNLLSQNILKIDNPQHISGIVELAPYLNSFEDWEKYVFLQLKDDSLRNIIHRVFNLHSRASLTEYIDVFKHIINNYVDSQELREFAETIFKELEENSLYKKLFEEIDYGEFVSLVELFFKRENKTTRPNYETVSILSPNTAQGNNFKYLFILNLNTGIFPQTLRDEFLEVTGRNEHILMQQIASFCTLLDKEKRIYVSFIRSSVYGKNLSPSFLVNELIRITGKKPDNPKIRDIFLNLPQMSAREDAPKSYQFNFVKIEFPLAVTSFSEYMVCPYKFFLGKVLNIQQSKTYDKRIPPYRTGQFIHELMQMLYRDIAINPDIEMGYLRDKIYQKFEEFIEEELIYITPSSRPFEYINLIKMRDNVLYFLEQDLQKIKSGQKIINPEFIEKVVSGENLTGKIDRLDTENGINVLYDYKTGYFSPKNKKVPKEVFQLVVYKNLLEKDGINVDKLSLILLNNEKGENIHTLEKNLIPYYESKLKEGLRSLKSKYFIPVADKDICYRCEYKDICDGGAS